MACNPGFARLSQSNAARSGHYESLRYREGDVCTAEGLCMHCGQIAEPRVQQIVVIVTESSTTTSPNLAYPEPQQSAAALGAELHLLVHAMPD